MIEIILKEDIETIKKGKKIVIISENKETYECEVLDCIPEKGYQKSKNGNRIVYIKKEFLNNYIKNYEC